MDIKIFMCCHKDFDTVPPLCTPIQCGSAINSPVDGALPDNIELQRIFYKYSRSYKKPPFFHRSYRSAVLNEKLRGNSETLLDVNMLNLPNNTKVRKKSKNNRPLQIRRFYSPETCILAIMCFRTFERIAGACIMKQADITVGSSGIPC